MHIHVILACHVSLVWSFSLGVINGPLSHNQPRDTVSKFSTHGSLMRRCFYACGASTYCVEINYSREHNYELGILQILQIQYLCS